ncbi:MAG: phosphodiester glycosidase family protein [Peptococcia bacterium]|jgi:exopolysaccharide biosynthesis protein
MRTVNILVALIIAPLLGMLLTLNSLDAAVQNLLIPVAETNNSLDDFQQSMFALEDKLALLYQQADEQKAQYEEQDQVLGDLTKVASKQERKSDQIYEERILKMLGPPVKEYASRRVEIKVFKLQELGYRGFIAKVKLYDPKVFKVVLAQDKIGAKETTMEAVQRTGAILGINGGGFYTEMRDGQPQGIHIGNVVIDGKLVGPFNAYPGNLSFSGINRKGRLIGGIFTEEDQLMSLDPWQGVSFIPVLIKGGVKHPIPPDWAKTNQPRTIIGEYANGDLIMIVVDGRQSDWSSGVTLERLIDKLIELGVKEGYNLDGGGSSTFIYQNEVLNRPSDGKLRPVVTNIVIMP